MSFPKNFPPAAFIEELGHISTRYLRLAENKYKSNRIGNAATYYSLSLHCNLLMANAAAGACKNATIIKAMHYACFGSKTLCQFEGMECEKSKISQEDLYLLAISIHHSFLKRINKYLENQIEESYKVLQSALHEDKTNCNPYERRNEHASHYLEILEDYLKKYKLTTTDQQSVISIMQTMLDVLNLITDGESPEYSRKAAISCANAICLHFKSLNKNDAVEIKMKALSLLQGLPADDSLSKLITEIQHLPLPV